MTPILTDEDRDAEGHLVAPLECGKAVELLMVLASKGTPAFNRKHGQQLLDEFTELVQTELK